MARFTELPTYRLHSLAAITERHGEQINQRLFGMRLIECRMLAVVQLCQPVSLRRACLEIELDKSQGSRLAAKLVAAGWLLRSADPADQRSFYLQLSTAGRALHRRIHQAAVQRNQAWLAGLAPARRDAFLATLDRQLAHARGLLEQELTAARPSTPAPRARAVPSTRPSHRRTA